MIDSSDEPVPLDPADSHEAVEPPLDPQTAETESVAEEWSGDDIEEAYQKALAAMADVPWQPEGSESDAEASTAAAAAIAAETEITSGTAEAKAASVASPHEVKPQGTGPRLARGTERQSKAPPEELSQVSPAQIIEAALFVGGGPLTAKKLCALLRGSYDVAFVEATVDQLNQQYFAEARPYEIVLGDGGYRLELRSEYEKLRQRVYGTGPREVKLSQDVLEVLALVAYQQPISQPEVESHGKQNAGNLLRQLLRRDLVAIQRGEGGRKDVRYLTTPRFLQVFGLGSIDELPQPDDLARK